MSTDLFRVAKQLTQAHADRLLAGAPVTVAALLLDAGRCTCGGPLIRGDRTARCGNCGREVEQ
jgi:hypothetical protein